MDKTTHNYNYNTRLYSQWSHDIDFDLDTGRYPNGSESAWDWEDNFIPVSHTINNKIVTAHVWRRDKIGLRGKWTLPYLISLREDIKDLIKTEVIDDLPVELPLYVEDVTLKHSDDFGYKHIPIGGNDKDLLLRTSTGYDWISQNDIKTDLTDYYDKDDFKNGILDVLYYPQSTIDDKLKLKSDVGHSHDEYATREELSRIEGINDLSLYYNKSEVNDLISNISTPDIPDIEEVSWGSVTGTLSDQIDLQLALDGKSDIIHTHVESDVTDLNKYTQSEVDVLLLSKEDSLDYTGSSDKQVLSVNATGDGYTWEDVSGAVDPNSHVQNTDVVIFNEESTSPVINLASSNSYTFEPDVQSYSMEFESDVTSYIDVIQVGINWHMGDHLIIEEDGVPIYESDIVREPIDFIAGISEGYYLTHPVYLITGKTYEFKVSGNESGFIYSDTVLYNEGIPYYAPPNTFVNYRDYLGVDYHIADKSFMGVLRYFKKAKVETADTGDVEITGKSLLFNGSPVLVYEDLVVNDWVTVDTSSAPASWSSTVMQYRIENNNIIHVIANLSATTGTTFTGVIGALPAAFAPDVTLYQTGLPYVASTLGAISTLIDTLGQLVVAQSTINDGDQFNINFRYQYK